MRPMALLTVYAAPTLAALQQHCAGFEDPGNGFTPSFAVKSPTDNYFNSTALIAHIYDINDSYRARLNLDNTQTLHEPYMGDYNKVYDPYPTRPMNLSELILIDRRYRYSPILSEILPGESVSYNITISGVYCAFVYNEGIGLSQDTFEFQTRHLFGDSPISHLHWLKIALLGLSFFLFRRFVIPRLFPKMSEHHLNEPIWNSLVWVAKGCYFTFFGRLAATCVFLSSRDFSVDDFRPAAWVFDPLIFQEGVISFISSVTLYLALVGLLSYRTDDPLDYSLIWWRQLMIHAIFFLCTVVIRPAVPMFTSSYPLISCLVDDVNASLVALIFSSNSVAYDLICQNCLEPQSKRGTSRPESERHWGLLIISMFLFLLGYEVVPLLRDPNFVAPTGTFWGYIQDPRDMYQRLLQLDVVFSWLSQLVLCS